MIERLGKWFLSVMTVKRNVISSCCRHHQHAGQIVAVTQTHMCHTELCNTSHKNTFEVNPLITQVIRFPNEMLLWCTAKQYWAMNLTSAVLNSYAKKRAKYETMNGYCVNVWYTLFHAHLNRQRTSQAQDKCSYEYTKDYQVKTNLFHLNTAHPPLEVQEDICLASIKLWWFKHLNTHLDTNISSLLFI